MKDLYFILGTDRNCTPRELNAAYGKLARKFQSDEPDQFLDNHFQEITEAYQILSDPVRRRKYDTAFRKNYQRRLYYFKIRHINIAVTLTLIFFTGLFGYYVLQSTTGHRIAKKVKTEVAAALPPIIKHHKRKHAALTPITAAGNQHNTTLDTPTVPLAKPVPPVQQLTNTNPQADSWPIANDPPATQPNNTQTGLTDLPAGSYTTTLQANSTGWVYLHATAGYRSNILESIPNQARVTVLEKGRDFYKISFNGQTGYVPRWTIADP